MPRKLQTYTAEPITVTYEPALCIHAAECVRRLPAVFDTRHRRWIRLEGGTADEVAAVVERCPTGALQYIRHDAGTEVPDAPPTVTATRNGPLYIRGAVELVTEDGVTAATRTRVALCRCGQSANKPFCDGSHRTAGFRSE